MKERKCSDCAKNNTPQCPSKGETFKEMYGGSFCLNRKDKPYFQLKGKFKSEDEIINGTIDITKRNLDCASGYSRGMHMIECPICGEIVNIITSVHLAKHNMTLFDFIKLNKDYVKLTALQSDRPPKEIDPEREAKLKKNRERARKNYLLHLEEMRKKKLEAARRRKELELKLPPKHQVGDTLEWSYYNKPYRGVVYDYDSHHYLIGNLQVFTNGSWVDKEGEKVIRR